MYNQDVIDRLNNLTNLYALKNANVKIISKKNEFGDMVKFFAQINTENIIQRITYKATGCTTFMALCSYFCEIVEGKTIDKALKINEKDLEKFSKLEESKTHVYKIILDTFALLIKKYNVGIKKGKIVPCEPLKEIEAPKTKVKKTNKIDEKKVISDIQSNYAYSSPSKKESKSSKDKKTNKVSKKSMEENSIASNSSVEDKVVKEIKPEIIVDKKNTETKKTAKSETKAGKVTKKTNEKVANDAKVKPVIETKIESVTKTKVEPVVEEKVETILEKKVTIEEAKPEKNLDRLEAIQRQKKALEQAKILAKSAEIAKIQSEKENKNKANNMKLSHLNALNDRIKNKETNEKMKSNTESLNNLLSKFKSSNSSTIKTVVVEDNSAESIVSKKESIDSKKNKDNKKNAIDKKSEKKQKKEKDKKEKDANPKTEKKKGLFSWFRK